MKRLSIRKTESSQQAPQHLRWLQCLMWAMLLTISAPAGAQDIGQIQGTGSPRDRIAILAVAQAYLRVTDERDQLSVSRAFHPLATLMSVTSQGGLNVMSQDVWWERVSRIPPGNLRRASRVALIDITGSAAVVRIDISSGETSSTDYLSLLKTRAGWRVVSKILSSPL